MKRNGFTLLELVVVLGLISILLMIAAGAIQRARMVAARVQCLNQMRQIGAAISISMDRGLYNTIKDHDGQRVIYAPQDKLLDILGIQNYWVDFARGTYTGSRVPLFICPGDSTANAVKDLEVNFKGITIPTGEYFFSTSYRGNALVFNSTKKLPYGVTDGLSNTIALVECNTFIQNHNEPIHYLYRCGVHTTIKVSATGDNGFYTIPSQRGAVFAHEGYKDVFPKRGSDGGTISSLDQVTFLDGGDTSYLAGYAPVSPHSGGIQILLLDGSARWVAKGVNPTPFWASVTPDWGD